MSWLEFFGLGYGVLLLLIVTGVCVSDGSIKRLTWAIRMYLTAVSIELVFMTVHIVQFTETGLLAVLLSLTLLLGTSVCLLVAYSDRRTAVLDLERVVRRAWQRGQHV